MQIEPKADIQRCGGTSLCGSSYFGGVYARKWNFRKYSIQLWGTQGLAGKEVAALSLSRPRTSWSARDCIGIAVSKNKAVN